VINTKILMLNNTWYNYFYGKKQNKRTFTAYIEYDPEIKVYIGTIPRVQGAHTQASTLDELKYNLKEVLELCIEENIEIDENIPEFVGTQQVEVTVWPIFPLSISGQWRKFYFI